MGFPRAWACVLIFFYVYINDFTLHINSLLEVIMFADDTSILVSYNNYDDFMKVHYTK
jgi:hypothetical protein